MAGKAVGVMDPDARNWNMQSQEDIGREFDRLRAQRDRIEGRTRQAGESPPAWRVGRPDAPGIWVLRMANRDLVTATVRWDEYGDYEGFDPETRRQTPRDYLRIDDGEVSEELDRAEGEIGRWVAMSFGPIPPPREMG